MHVAATLRFFYRPACSLTLPPAGTAETAKLVQKWATPKSGALSSAEVQARAVTAQGVDDIAVQVRLVG